MSTDTRPSVMVVGTIYLGANGGVVHVNNMEHVQCLGIEDGDEVLVTIRRREAREEAGEPEEYGWDCDCIDCFGAERIDWRP